ncbi:MAG TPA: hypothetical protein VNO52_13700, partial [Methylomirabilota bacterium]|nr:hypothetical protein [Methylomirabilota bacterium]
MKNTLCRLFLLAGLSAGADRASALPVEILPRHYSFDQATDTGTYSYHDETGMQLVDGVRGIAPWDSDLGHGPGYEWVGWASDPVVNIDFTFGSLTRIDAIHVSTTQDHLDDVVLPHVFLYADNGTGFSLIASLLNPESSANDRQYRTFQFDTTGLDALRIRVSLHQSLDGPWTFTDEIDFFQNRDCVPESTSTGW